MNIHVVIPSLSGFSEVADFNILPQQSSPLLPHFLLFHVLVNPTATFYTYLPLHE
jgi:hypothetical protein